MAIARTLKPFGVTEISVVVQTSLEETPAVRKVRLQAEAQVNAEAAVADDPVVQSILKEFGGRVQRVVPISEVLPVSEKARSRS